jgi:hypothetical protein
VQQPGVERDVGCREAAEVAARAQPAHRRGQQAQLGDVGRTAVVLAAQPRGTGLDGGPQLLEVAHHSEPFGSLDAPSDDVGVQGVPPVRGQHPGTDPLPGLHQTLGLEHPQRLAHHRPGDAVLLRDLLGHHPAAGHQLAGGDPEPEIGDDRVLTRLRHALRGWRPAER